MNERPGENVGAVAESVGRQLVARLDDARRWSDDWSDRRRAAPLVTLAADEAMHALARTGCWGEANRVPSSRFWNVAEPVLHVGSLLLRARTKPRGYAGDFKMLAKICAGFECDDPLGAILDRYFLDQAAPQAVAARAEMICGVLLHAVLNASNRPVKIVAVGSGPAVELQRLFAALPESERGRCRLVLLDLDPAALKYAVARLEPLLPASAELQSHHLNLMRLARRAADQVHLAEADVIYSAGLFDYFDDAQATAMLALFWRNLAAGGRLLAGNFAPHNPTRAFMEWVGNWYLSYRPPAAMHELALAAGIPPESLTITADRTGVDLFWSADRAG